MKKPRKYSAAGRNRYVVDSLFRLFLLIGFVRGLVCLGGLFRFFNFFRLGMFLAVLSVPGFGFALRFFSLFRF
jgi:hypothetical protein